MPLEIPSVDDDDSQAHLDRMSQLYSMQDMFVHFGVSGHNLNHQVDTWAAAQSFRDHLAGEPPAPHYGRYRYPEIETPIQLG